MESRLELNGSQPFHLMGGMLQLHRRKTLAHFTPYVVQSIIYMLHNCCKVVEFQLLKFGPQCWCGGERVINQSLESRVPT